LFQREAKCDDFTVSLHTCLIDSKPSFVAKVLRSAISLSDSLPVLNAIAVVIAVRQEPKFWGETACDWDEVLNTDSRSADK